MTFLESKSLSDLKCSGEKKTTYKKTFKKMNRKVCESISCEYCDASNNQYDCATIDGMLKVLSWAEVKK